MSIQKEIEKRVANEMAARAVPMSATDSVVIRQAQPDAIGTYIDAQQVNQDVFANAVAQERAMNQAREAFQPIHPIFSPNTTVVQPTRPRAASADGTQIVIF